MMNLWIEGSIAPSIQANQKVLDYAEFEWDSTLITFNLQDTTSTIDPFSRTNNIVTPLLFKVINYTISESPQILYSDVQYPSQFPFPSGSIVLNNLNIIDETHNPGSFYILVLAQCSDDYIGENANCSSKDSIKQYMSEFHGFLSINFNLQQYNSNTQQLETIIKTVYQGLSQAYPQFNQISIKSQETVVDDGILFENNNYYNSINSFDMITQQINSEYITNILKSLQFSSTNNNIDSILALQMTIDTISIHMQVTTPKLNTVLAQIGAIVQVIFFLRYLVFYINKALQDLELSRDIITMYYPKLQNIIIQGSVLGKVKIVPESIQYQSDVFLAQYQQIIEVAKQKCRLTNILYEISRLQFILEQHLGLDVLQGCHYLGSKALNSDIASLHSNSNRSNRISSQQDIKIENENLSDAIKLLLRPQFRANKQL